MNLSRSKILILSIIPLTIGIVLVSIVILTSVNKFDQDLPIGAEEQFGYEIMGTGSGGGGIPTQMINELQKQIVGMFGEKLNEKDIPISYGNIPILPDAYRALLIDKMLTPVDYLPQYIFNTRKSEWKVYDVAGEGFKEFYHQYSTDQYYKNGLRLFLVNEKDKKFIAIAYDIFPDNEKQFLEVLANTYEQSPFYKNYPLLEIPILISRDGFGYDTQFTFNSLYSSYKSIVRDARGFYENNKWEIDYFTSNTFYDFINSKKVEKGSEAEDKKLQILNRIKE